MKISIENTPDLYHDYEKCLEHLKGLDINVKNNESNNFHIYSEIRNRKELLCIKSYFATQDYKKHKLILWSDYDVTDNELLKPFKEYIDFRIYDPVELSKDTPVEGKSFINQRDNLYYLNSDLLRLLCCYKYGGCWIDMDIVFLRDMSCLLKDEFLYVWGSDLNFEEQGCCGTVMNLKKGSKLGQLFLEEIQNSPMVSNSTCWGKSLFGSVYKNKMKFDILPCAYFNTEWGINYKYPGAGDVIEAQWFSKPLENNDHLFTSAFTWHWHNSSHKKDEIVEDSKFNKLEKIIDKKLKEKFYD